MKNLMYFNLIFLLMVLSLFAQTETKKDTVTVTGKYILGGNDSQTDAKQYALLDAKRKALEQFGTYLTSTTTVENYQLTQDEITTFTAGLMQTTILKEELKTEGEYMSMLVTIQAIIDPQEVDESLKRHREANESGNDLPLLKAGFDKIPTETISPSESIDKTKLEHLREKWREIERTELLTQIVVESRKPRPDLNKMKNLVTDWYKKYPRLKFIDGYIGIALFKNNKIKAAIPVLRSGIKNLSISRRMLSEDVNKEKFKLINAQEKQFRHYLDLSLNKKRRTHRP